jgi:hypothetical protein
MRFKALIVLAICGFWTQVVEAVDKENLSSHQVLKLLKTCHEFEEAGSDTYGVGGNITCEKLLESTGRSK